MLHLANLIKRFVLLLCYGWVEKKEKQKKKKRKIFSARNENKTSTYSEAFLFEKGTSLHLSLIYISHKALFPSIALLALVSFSFHVCLQKQHFNCDGNLNQESCLFLLHTATPNDGSGFKVVTSE